MWGWVELWWRGWGEFEESGSLSANTHVSDDEAIANMGHPDLWLLGFSG